MFLSRTNNDTRSVEPDSIRMGIHQNLRNIQIVFLFLSIHLKGVFKSLHFFLF